MEPGNNNGRKDTFIFNTQELLNAQELLNGQNKHISNVQRTSLLMHPSTLKKLHFVEGCLVFLNSEKEQLLFRCWSSVSMKSDSILLPSLDLFYCNLKGDINVNSYNLLIDLADRITLSCDKYKYFMESKAFKRFLQFKLDHFYLKEGLTLSLIYLGYPCHFTVQKIEPATSFSSIETMNLKDLDDIVKNISSLDITADNSSSDGTDEKSFLCSTPISSKSAVNTKKFQSIKFDNISETFSAKSKIFYLVHLRTSIKIEYLNNDNTLKNKIIFKDIGGLKKPISKIKTLITFLLNQDKKENSGIILVGASGTGKSMMVQAAGNEFHLPVFNFDSFIFSRNKTGFKYHVEKVIKEAIDNSPSILFLDDIDLLSMNNNVSDSQADSMPFFLSSEIFNVLNSEKEVIVIGAAQSLFNVNALLRKSGTLEKELVLGIPSTEDRREILSKVLYEKAHNLNYEEITQISDMTHGFTGGDLKLLCGKAMIGSYQKTEKISTCYEDFKEVLKEMKPSSVAEFTFEMPNVKWADIGGMQKVKDAITEMVDWPLKHTEQFRRFKITPARGILMYGPPGCSKTMIAKALVSESHLNFISIKGPQLFNKYVGESEKSVSELFKKARSAAPCVLFFDEIDSLASIRGRTSGNSNVAERILTQLLIEIDGIDVLQGVSIIAATNRPDMIDPSFLRPGRFDQMIYVPLPDAATRKEIFAVKLKNVPIDSDVDINYLVEATKGYTGAEITDICREAAMSAIKCYITSSAATISKIHFLTALKSIQPRTSKKMIEFYENYSKRI